MILGSTNSMYSVCNLFECQPIISLSNGLVFSKASIMQSSVCLHKLDTFRIMTFGTASHLLLGQRIWD